MVFRPKIPQPNAYRCTMMRCHQQLNIQNCSCNCPFPLWKLSCSWFAHILRENGRKLCGFCISPTFIYLILLPSHLLLRSEFSNNSVRISWSEFQLDKQIFRKTNLKSKICFIVKDFQFWATFAPLICTLFLVLKRWVILPPWKK